MNDGLLVPKDKVLLAELPHDGQPRLIPQDRKKHVGLHYPRRVNWSALSKTHARRCNL